MTDALPDVLATGLRVVFSGTAAGTASARLRSYYAGPGNRFWTTLLEVGLTPCALKPCDFSTDSNPTRWAQLVSSWHPRRALQHDATGILRYGIRLLTAFGDGNVPDVAVHLQNHDNLIHFEQIGAHFR